MDRIYIIGRDEIPQKIVLGAGESLKVTFVALPGVDSDLALTVELTGEGAELDAAGLFVCRADEHVSIRMNVRHLAGGCRSNQLFRGVADGRSQVQFNGLIYVQQDAQKTEAHQSCNSLLLNEGARVQTEPQLEIYADDVVCSHGAAIGYLSADEMFYMWFLAENKIRAVASSAGLRRREALCAACSNALPLMWVCLFG